MRVRAFLLAAAISIPVPFVAGHAADFDHGKMEQTSPFIRSRERAAAVPARKARRVGKSRALAAQNVLENYLRNHAALSQMRSLLRDPRMGQLEMELQERLRAEGTSRVSERDGMLPDAVVLDAEDARLAAEKQRLDASKQSLDARLADIDRQVAEHAAACLPTHPPERHSWCVSNAARINGIIAVYNADVRTHNAALAKWESDSASLDSRWNTFVESIQSWEALVKDVIDEIKIYFASPTGDCTPDQHRGLQQAVKVACDSGSRACTGAQDCDLLRTNYRKNLACAEARDEINKTCYRGGNPGHRKAADDARRAAKICLDLIETKCPVDPAIHR